MIWGWIPRVSRSGCFLPSSLSSPPGSLPSSGPAAPAPPTSLCIAGASFLLVPFPRSTNSLVLFPPRSLPATVCDIHPLPSCYLTSESRAGPACGLRLVTRSLLPPLLLCSSCPCRGPRGPSTPHILLIRFRHPLLLEKSLLGVLGSPSSSCTSGVFAALQVCPWLPSRPSQASAAGSATFQTSAVIAAGSGFPAPSSLLCSSP